MCFMSVIAFDVYNTQHTMPFGVPKPSMKGGITWAKIVIYIYAVESRKQCYNLINFRIMCCARQRCQLSCSFLGYQMCKLLSDGTVYLYTVLDESLYAYRIFPLLYLDLAINSVLSMIYRVQYGKKNQSCKKTQNKNHSIA